MPWYAQTGPRRRRYGKFQSQAKLGTEASAGAQYRGWHYSFVAHATGSGVQRTRYAVSIRDGNQNRVAYLRDCASIAQATEAAKRWIDDTMNRIAKRRAEIGLGSLPTLPS